MEQQPTLTQKLAERMDKIEGAPEPYMAPKKVEKTEGTPVDGTEAHNTIENPDTLNNNPGCARITLFLAIISLLVALTTVSIEEQGENDTSGATPATTPSQTLTLTPSQTPTLTPSQTPTPKPTLTQKPTEVPEFNAPAFFNRYGAPINLEEYIDGDNPTFVPTGINFNTTTTAEFKGFKKLEVEKGVVQTNGEGIYMVPLVRSHYDEVNNLYSPNLEGAVPLNIGTVDDPRIVVLNEQLRDGKFVIVAYPVEIIEEAHNSN